MTALAPSLTHLTQFLSLVFEAPVLLHGPLLIILTLL